MLYLFPDDSDSCILQGSDSSEKKTKDKNNNIFRSWSLAEYFTVIWLSLTTTTQNFLSDQPSQSWQYLQVPNDKEAWYNDVRFQILKHKLTCRFLKVLSNIFY